MSLMRWDPFRGAFSLLNGRTRLPGTEGTSPIGLMDLALDMYETEDSVVVDGITFKSRVLRVNLEQTHRVFPYLATCGTEPLGVGD